VSVLVHGPPRLQLQYADAAVERDLSLQQQFLDVVILRRKRGRISFRLPDGLDNLATHNLISFKSHHEALDDWAMKELIGHYVAYRKLVSRSPSELLPEEQFRLYAVCARYPHNLACQVPWQQQQAGVYHCRWGTDLVHVIVAGQLPREAHNAPLHLFRASPELVEFACGAFTPRSENTSGVLQQLLTSLEKEGFAMSYTMEDFKRDYIKKEFPTLTPQEQQEVLQSLPPEKRREMLQALLVEEWLAGLSVEERLAGLSEEEIQRYLKQMNAGRPSGSRKLRRKK
jgi:hypothetical protein